MSRVRGGPVSGVCSRRLAILWVAGLVAVCAGPGRAIQAQDWSAQLGGVEATGLKRVPAAQVVALSGLQAGQIISPPDVEAARQRLLKSGLFTSVGYRYRNAGYLLVVTFVVQEVAWQTPVVFDNFVDQTDAQLVAAIGRDVPTFDGMAPDQDVVLKRMATALERLARESKDPGVVSYALIYDKAQGGNHWRFRLDRASGPVPICAISVPGLPAAIAAVVRERMASLVGADYSRDLVLTVASQTVVPLVAAQGATQARVSRVDVRRAPRAPDCENGVTVTIMVDFGRRSWAAAPPDRTAALVPVTGLTARPEDAGWPTGEPGAAPTPAA